MQVKAEIPLFKEVYIEVNENEKIKDLKRKICERLNLPENLTLLLLNGKVLPENSLIKEFNFKSKAVTIDYLWARFLPLWGEKAQKALRESSIILVGAGALGNEIAKNLAMLGIGEIIIVDYDKVEFSNLTRNVFFDENDIGNFKSLVLAKKLKSKYSYLKIEVYNCKIEDLPLEVFLRSNVIISGLDNLASRVYLSIIASKYKIPLIDGGINGYQGRIQVFIPPNSPCPICAIPLKDYGRLIGLRNPCSNPIIEGTVPSLPTVASLVSAIQAQEAVKLIFNQKIQENIEKPLNGLLILDLRFNRYNILELKKNPECIVCGRNGLGKSETKIIEVSIEDCLNSIAEMIKIASIKTDLKEPHEITVFKENFKGELIKLPAFSKLDEYKLKKGSLIRAIFKNLKQEDYKEVLIKLI
ncbi:MAG: ThiF family adenylyltransferase [Candidatus Bathyarchaeia archaeon]